MEETIMDGGITNAILLLIGWLAYFRNLAIFLFQNPIYVFISFICPLPYYFYLTKKKRVYIGYWESTFYVLLYMLLFLGIVYPVIFIAFGLIWHIIYWIFSSSPYLLLQHMVGLYGAFNKEIACVTIFGLYIFYMHSEYELWKKRNKR